MKLELPKPTRANLEKWFVLFEKRMNFSFGLAPSTLAKKLYGNSYAEAAAFATSARESGFGVLIAAAGKAAHLAGALAAQTTLPVIGIPVKSSTLDGLDALLSTVQMPSGMPVATVAIDGAANAALLAAQILAVEDETLAEKLLAMRKAQHDAVIAKDAALVVE